MRSMPLKKNSIGISTVDAYASPTGPAPGAPVFFIRYMNDLKDT